MLYEDRNQHKYFSEENLWTLGLLRIDGLPALKIFIWIKDVSKVFQKRKRHLSITISYCSSVLGKFITLTSLTLSRRRSLSYRSQSIYFLCKSMNSFLYDKDLRHEKVMARQYLQFFRKWTSLKGTLGTLSNICDGAYCQNN